MDIKKETKELFQLEKINIFAAIVFTDKDEFLSQVLVSKENDDLFTALNAITDKNLLVYSVKLEHGKYGFPELPPGIFGYMVPVWKEPLKNSNFLKQFELSNSEDLPIILFWCFDEKGEVRQKTVSLSKNYTNKNEAYLDLKKYFKAASDTINFISPENLLTPNVFRNVDDTIDTLENKKRILEVFDKFKKLYEIASIFQK